MWPCPWNQRLRRRTASPSWRERPSSRWKVNTGRRTKGRLASAPLPRYAAAMVGRLLGGGVPYRNVQEFHAALAASAEKPVETTRGRRLAHLTVLAVFLSFGMCAGLSPVALMSPVAAVMASTRIRQTEAVRERMAEVTAVDAADLEKADPKNHPIVLRQIAKDAEIKEALTGALERIRRERQARLDALSWPGRSYAAVVEKQINTANEPQPPLWLPPASQPDSVRAFALQIAAERDPVKNEAMSLAKIQTVLLLFWPAAWCLWAFLSAGG